VINGLRPDRDHRWMPQSVAPLRAGSGGAADRFPGWRGAALFVLDGWLRPVPVGAVGELYGGRPVVVAVGYVGRWRG